MENAKNLTQLVDKLLCKKRSNDRRDWLEKKGDQADNF